MNGLYRNGGDDYLSGLGGHGVLDGGLGQDFTVGGTGDDIQYVDDPLDIVLENAGEGSDAIYASSSIGLREGVEVERIGTINFLSTAAIYITSNEFSQDIIGNNGNNQLSGLGGNDYLISLEGGDILNGGTGLDTMEGGAGDDILYVDNAGDVVREDAGEGQDAAYRQATPCRRARVSSCSAPRTSPPPPPSTSAATSATTTSSAITAPTCFRAAPDRTTCGACRMTTRCSAASFRTS